LAGGINWLGVLAGGIGWLGYYFPFRLMYCVAGGGNIGNKAK